MTPSLNRSGTRLLHQHPPCTAAQRSLMYQHLCAAFRYPDGESASAFGLPARAENPGPVFLDAFDPGVSTRACSLHEADHAGTERTAVFEELLRFYAYFGLARTPSSELPDHLTVELEFLHFLTFLQHQIEQDGQSAANLIRAQYDFISRHLLRLTRGIVAGFKCTDLHYVSLVEALSQFVEQDFLQIGAETRAD